MSLSKFFRQTLFAFLLLLIPSVMLKPPGEEGKYTVSDFFGYYVQARLLAQGRFSDSYDTSKMEEAVYQDFPGCKEVGRHNFISLGMPEPNIFLLPLAVIPPSAAYYFGLFAVMLAVTASLPLLADVFAITDRQYMFVAPIVSLSGPVWEVVRVTKPTAFILLGFALTLWICKCSHLKNSRLKNVAAALAFQAWTFKVNEVIPLLAVCFGGRQFRFLAWVIGLTAVITVITLPSMGIDSYIKWTEFLRTYTQHPEWASPQLEPTLRGQLLRFDMTHLSAINRFSEIVFACVVAGLALFGNFIRNHKDYLYFVAMTLPISFLFSLHSYSYDFVLMIPSCLAFANLSYIKSLPIFYRLACFTLFGMCLFTFELPFYTIIHYSFLVTNIWTINPLFIALAALTILFFAVIVAALIDDKKRLKLNA